MIAFKFFYKHNIKEATIDFILTPFNHCPNTHVYVCIFTHAFILTHTWTHTYAHYYFTLRLLIPFYLYVCLINYISLVCHPSLLINTPLCLISVVCCSGINVWRGREKKKVELIQVNWLLFFILPVALPTEPFSGYFCGVKYCSKVLSFLWNVHCIVAVILLLSCFQTSILDVFANTNWSN